MHSRIMLRQAILAINIPTSFADREVSNLSNSDGRLQQLDGLRGLAALVVVIFHFLSAFAPDFIPDQTDRPNLLADTPFGILFNGPFAVSIFFVLSGFVVSNAAAKRKTPIYLNLVLRYVRLAVPVLFSVIFAWALLKLIPTATLALGTIMPHTWLHWTYQGEIPSLLTALRHGILTVFIRGNSNFNNVLWTMQLELLGSFALYLIYGSMLGWLRTVSLLTLGIVCCTGLIPVPYLCFVLALQLQCSSEVSAASVGLVSSPPERPCENTVDRDAPLSEFDSDATDFLD
jgi:peptidoglycan/LPS O-acetylase OafA/YrhL